MNNFHKHRVDEIFRIGLNSPDQNEVDEDWALMKSQLKNQKRRSIVPSYMIFVSSIAAILLMVFAVMYNSNISFEDEKDTKGKIQSATATLTPRKENNIVKTEKSNSIEQAITDRSITSSYPVKDYYSHIGLKAGIEEPLVRSAEVEQRTVASPQIADASINTSLLSVISPEVNINSAVSEDVVGIQTPLFVEDVAAVEEKDGAKASSNADKSRISIAINFAPDVNGVEQIQNNKLSYSLGAALVYQISNKFSIEAGAAYGKKTYQTGFSSFRPASYSHFQIKPNTVSSGFDVMDLQLNMDYTLLKKGRSTIGLGAGISSYLMLNEQYSFTYQNMNARGVSSFRTGYQNNHFFGIANLNLSYKTSLSNNIKLAFNPYLKLPLTDLGYGNIRLRSAGVSVGLITNLNKRTE